MLGMTKGMLGMTPLFLLNEAHFSFCHAERSEAPISGFLCENRNNQSVRHPSHPCVPCAIVVWIPRFAQNDTKKVLGMTRKELSMAKKEMFGITRKKSSA